MRQTASSITVWLKTEVATDAVWEAAYSRFETPQQEQAKFRARLTRLGANGWSRQARIVELFCGRGGGLHALAAMGFVNLEGVDLSGNLLAAYQGPARLYQGDCRRLGLPDASRDVVVIHGGLHHLPDFPEGFASVLPEIARVLVPGGRLAFVEPWLTPFLRGVHSLCGRSWLRRSWGKLDALATMIDGERSVYFPWLENPAAVRRLLSRHFETRKCRASFGKLLYVGRKSDTATADRMSFSEKGTG